MLNIYIKCLFAKKHGKDDWYHFMTISNTLTFSNGSHLFSVFVLNFDLYGSDIAQNVTTGGAVGVW